MEGVTVLKVIPVNPTAFLFGIVLLVVGASFLFASIKALHDGVDVGWVLLILSIFLLVFSFILMIAPEGYQESYKVTISEDVSMIKFYEKYEIVDQDGLIFTVRERK